MKMKVFHLKLSTWLAYLTKNVVISKVFVVLLAVLALASAHWDDTPYGARRMGKKALRSANYNQQSSGGYQQGSTQSASSYGNGGSNGQQQGYGQQQSQQSSYGNGAPSGNSYGGAESSQSYASDTVPLFSAL